MKIKIITLIAILATSTSFSGGFDDNAKGGATKGNTIPPVTNEPSPESKNGESTTPQSQGSTRSSSSNISGMKIKIKNNQKNNKLTIKSDESTTVNVASIHLGRGTNASGAKINLRNNQRNNRTYIKSRRGSSTLNVANVNVE